MRSQSKAMTIAGWIVSILPVLLLLFSATMKFVGGEEVAKGFTHIGWPSRLAMALGVTELACTILYLIPRTAVLGAVLLTGYLGGAIATHARIEEQFIGPALAGVFLWLGLYLRDARIRALLPLN